jgi:eight-cysteine-cluster-containing protein
MIRAILMLSSLACVACATPDDGSGSAQGPIVVPPCHVGGCSAQVCSERDDVVTTCEYRREYGCYRTARCEPQADGQCGWTQTPELTACIEAARQE